MKGQVFTFDFIVGFFGFIILVIIALTYLVEQQPSVSYEEAYKNNLFISNTLLSEGFPKNWTNETVILPGIAKNNRLNITKLDAFNTLSYGERKALFHTSSEFLFYFENASGIVNISGCNYGYPLAANDSCDPQLDTISFENLIKTERFIVHNTSIMKMIVYSWN